MEILQHQSTVEVHPVNQSGPQLLNCTIILKTGLNKYIKAGRGGGGGKQQHTLGDTRQSKHLNCHCQDVVMFLRSITCEKLDY